MSCSPDDKLLKKSKNIPTSDTVNKLTLLNSSDSPINFSACLSSEQNNISAQKNQCYTNETCPLITGSAPINSVVKIIFGSTIYYAKTDHKGRWDILVTTPLAPGKIHFTAQLMDDHGEIIKQLTNTFEVSIKVDLHVYGFESFNGSIDKSGVIDFSSPRLHGVSSPYASVRLDVYDKSYRTIADFQGKWVIEISDNYLSGIHDYLLIALDELNNASSLEGHFIVNELSFSRLKLETAKKNKKEKQQSTNKIAKISDDNRPIFEGMAMKDAIIVLKINGESYTGETKDSGEWKIKINNPLPNGLYVLTVSFYSKLDNSLIIKIKDHIGIASNKNYTIHSSKLTDQVNVIIKENTVTFTGLSEANKNVHVSVDDPTKEYIQTADKHGRWEFPWPCSLSEGKHQYFIKFIKTNTENSYVENEFIIEALKSSLEIEKSKSDEFNDEIKTNSLDNEKNELSKGKVKRQITSSPALSVQKNKSKNLQNKKTKEKNNKSIESKNDILSNKTKRQSDLKRVNTKEHDPLILRHNSKKKQGKLFPKNKLEANFGKPKKTEKTSIKTEKESPAQFNIEETDEKCNETTKPAKHLIKAKEKNKAASTSNQPDSKLHTTGLNKKSTSEYSEPLIFEGKILSDTRYIDVQFNGKNINVEICVSSKTWRSAIPCEMINDSVNYYAISSIQADGSIRTVEGIYPNILGAITNVV